MCPLDTAKLHFCFLAVSVAYSAPVLFCLPGAPSLVPVVVVSWFVALWYLPFLMQSPCPHFGARRMELRLVRECFLISLGCLRRLMLLFEWQGNSNVH